MYLIFHFIHFVVDVFSSLLVCDPDLFSLNRFMSFEQLYNMYNTVVFIYIPDILQTFPYVEKLRIKPSIKTS